MARLLMQALRAAAGAASGCRGWGHGGMRPLAGAAGLSMGGSARCQGCPGGPRLSRKKVDVLQQHVHRLSSDNLTVQDGFSRLQMMWGAQQDLGDLPLSSHMR